MPDPDIKSALEEGLVTPEERARIEKSLKKKEVVPSTRDRTDINWKDRLRRLGQPFDVEAIPYSKLRQMRLDPIISFGLHYTKVPLVRSQWHMNARDKNGPNARVAAFMDAAWRPIHATYILQHLLSLDFGHAPIAKRFREANPGGVYVDPSEPDPETSIKPVWDEGNILPIVWKTFVSLEPERSTPMFNDSTGEFKGIEYELPQNINSNLGFKAKFNTDKSNLELDVYHSLWATNERETVFGSLWGYPRIGYASRFWWSYWFRYAHMDRAFERLAVPPLVAYHPEGFHESSDGERISYQEIALNAAESIRANAIAAVPSTLARSGLDDKVTNQREWEFKFLETQNTDFRWLDEQFNYLDVMKLRAIWVPEQAFMEGEGGTSSRNVASQMAEVFFESQAKLFDEIADHINRFILPQLLIVNFPEFVNEGGKCEIVGHGFADEEKELLKQLIQLVGQADPMKLGVDLPTALSRLGVPTLDPVARKEEEQRAIAQAAAAGPPTVSPTQSSVGVVPFTPGNTNGGSVPEPNDFGSSVTGFSDTVYIQPNNYIELSSQADFLSGLPKTKHYQDKMIKALALQMRKTYRTYYGEIYVDFASYLKKNKNIELADDKFSINEARKLAKKLVDEWSLDKSRVEDLFNKSSSILKRIIKRSVELERKKSNVNEIQFDSDLVSGWVEEKASNLVSEAHDTVRNELESFLTTQLFEGRPLEDIATNLSEHFSDFPEWKSTRVARAETRDSVNASTLFAAESAGLKYVQAKDAQLGPTDDDCENRDGKMFTIREAWKEMSHGQTHPNCTLEFDLVPLSDFSIQMVAELPKNAPEFAMAFFDVDSKTAYIKMDAQDRDIDLWLFELGHHIINNNGHKKVTA